MTLTGGDYAMIAALLAGLVGVPMGVVGLYMRSMRADALAFQSSIRGTIDDHESRIRAVESSKVSHTDWVRVSVSQMKRQDATLAELKELSGKVDASIGALGAFNRAAGAMERIANNTEQRDERG